MGRERNEDERDIETRLYGTEYDIPLAISTSVCSVGALSILVTAERWKIDGFLSRACLFCAASYNMRIALHAEVLWDTPFRFG